MAQLAPLYATTDSSTRDALHACGNTTHTCSIAEVLNPNTCFVGSATFFDRLQDTAAAAIFLASKVEEFRVHIKDVMMVTYKIRHKNERKLVENSDVSRGCGEGNSLRRLFLLMKMHT